MLSTDANLTAYSSDRWAAVERKRARRQVRWTLPLERVRGRPTQSTVDEASHRCSFVGFNTLCAERARAPRNARVFFEVTIERCVGVVQLGWIGTVVRCDQESGDGVGDDQVSWGVDGIRLKKWAGGDTPYRTARKWRDGDVIGCAADLRAAPLLRAEWSLERARRRRVPRHHDARERPRAGGDGRLRLRVRREPGGSAVAARTARRL